MNNGTLKCVYVFLLQVALDLLQTVIRSSTPPIADILITDAFPSAVAMILSSDDNSIMQVKLAYSFDNYRKRLFHDCNTIALLM